MELRGTSGIISSLGFFVAWVHVMYCTIMIVRTTPDRPKLWWLDPFWMHGPLPPAAARYRRRALATIILVVAAFLIAIAVHPAPPRA